MSLFDTLFGRKPSELKTIPQWEDTTPPESEVAAHTTFGKPLTEEDMNAAWPFPSAALPQSAVVGIDRVADDHFGGNYKLGTHDKYVAPASVEVAEPLVVNTNKIAQYHAEQAAWRRAEKARLKEIVTAAPEYGIEFVHVGTTTFAWRYHSEEEGFVRNKLLIDISSAVCNPNDQFAKWHGSAIAAERMLDDQFITVRIDSAYASPRDAVFSMGAVSLPTKEVVALTKERQAQRIIKGLD